MITIKSVPRRRQLFIVRVSGRVLSLARVTGIPEEAVTPVIYSNFQMHPFVTIIRKLSANQCLFRLVTIGTISFSAGRLPALHFV